VISDDHYAGLDVRHVVSAAASRFYFPQQETEGKNTAIWIHVPHNTHTAPTVILHGYQLLQKQTDQEQLVTVKRMLAALSTEVKEAKWQIGDVSSTSMQRSAESDGFVCECSLNVAM
jgi:hypothetical protein